MASPLGRSTVRSFVFRMRYSFSLTKTSFASTSINILIHILELIANHQTGPDRETDALADLMNSLDMQGVGELEEAIQCLTISMARPQHDAPAVDKEFNMQNPFTLASSSHRQGTGPNIHLTSH